MLVSKKTMQYIHYLYSNFKTHHFVELKSHGIFKQIAHCNMANYQYFFLNIYIMRIVLHVLKIPHSL